MTDFVETRGVRLDRTGRGVRVAIVDSGVEASHPWLEKASIQHVRVDRQGERFAIIPADPVDLSGHGTACAGIIHRLVPEAQITSVCALSAEGKGSRDGLIRFFDRASARPCDGPRNPSHQRRFLQPLHRLNRLGPIR